MEPYLEGLLLAPGYVGPVAQMMMTDCHMRVHTTLWSEE
jgi:hypothetical protein